MSERARRQAFAVAVLAIAAAVALLLVLGSPSEPDDEGEDRTGSPSPGRIVIAPPSAPRREPRRQAQRQRGDEPRAVRDLSAARAVAERFAIAYLARDSGRMTPATRRALRATTTRSLWAQLREPPRVTPAWRPSPARLEEVSGLSAGHGDATLEATIAYRRGGRGRFLSVTLARTGERWRARRVGR